MNPGGLVGIDSGVSQCIGNGLAYQVKDSFGTCTNVATITGANVTELANTAYETIVYAKTFVDFKPNNVQVMRARGDGGVTIGTTTALGAAGLGLANALSLYGRNAAGTLWFALATLTAANIAQWSSANTEAEIHGATYVDTFVGGARKVRTNADGSFVIGSTTAGGAVGAFLPNNTGVYFRNSTNATWVDVLYLDNTDIVQFGTNNNVLNVMSYSFVVNAQTGNAQIKSVAGTVTLETNGSARVSVANTGLTSLLAGGRIVSDFQIPVTNNATPGIAATINAIRGKFILSLGNPTFTLTNNKIAGTDTMVIIVPDTAGVGTTLESVTVTANTAVVTFAGGVAVDTTIRFAVINP